MAGQSDPHVSLFSPEEIEFMAEDELVEIVPNMTMDPLNFICGRFGPFLPQIATQVPLWLAVSLKRRGKCTIRSPPWLSVENLNMVLEGERDFRSFQALPFHYMEISKILFDQAHDDIPDIYLVRSLIEDIRNVRFHKIETELQNFGSAYAITGTNLSAMEVNIVRPFVGRALQAFYKHANQDLMPDTDNISDRQPRASNNRQTRTLKPR